jgi:GTPase SAR1 family protein
MFGLVRGFIEEIKNKSTAKSSILVIGIDGAGKTTLVESLMQHAIPTRRPKTVRPTSGLNTESISDGKTFLRFWDLSGSESFRGIWNNYLVNATVVLYVVNGTQNERIHESRKLFDDVSLKFPRKIGVVFLHSNGAVLEVFPADDRATVFFIDLAKADHIRVLYEWLKSTAVRGDVA